LGSANYLPTPVIYQAGLQESNLGKVVDTSTSRGDVFLFCFIIIEVAL
jgi:hypothetical protein